MVGCRGGCAVAATLAAMRNNVVMNFMCGLSSMREICLNRKTCAIRYGSYGQRSIRAEDFWMLFDVEISEARCGSLTERAAPAIAITNTQASSVVVRR